MRDLGERRVGIEVALGCPAVPPMTPRTQKPRGSRVPVKRMTGLEPSTFCMATTVREVSAGV